MLKGIDFSHWQGKMDFTKVKAKMDAGELDFGIIRAGSIDNNTGVCYTDYQFEANVAGCKSIGLPYAFYWFFRPNHSVTKQAEYFLALASGKYDDRMAVDLWCDIEVAGDAGKVDAFCDLLCQKAVTGIYSNPNTILYLLTGNKAGLADFDLWLADWSPPANVPAPWKDWAIWQYAVKPDGADYGAQSKSLDHNYAQDWMLTLPEPEPPDDELVKRVEALEVARQELENDISFLTVALGTLTARVTALEQRPTPSGAVFKVGSSTANARYAARYNDARKPVMEIFEPRVQLKPGTYANVNPVAVTADGGSKYFPLLDHISPQLYVRAQDGVLQVG